MPVLNIWFIIWKKQFFPWEVHSKVLHHKGIDWFVSEMKKGRWRCIKASCWVRFLLQRGRTHHIRSFGQSYPILRHAEDWDHRFQALWKQRGSFWKRWPVCWIPLLPSLKLWDGSDRFRRGPLFAMASKSSKKGSTGWSIMPCFLLFSSISKTAVTWMSGQRFSSQRIFT